jgi:hypothetical protein
VASATAPAVTSSAAVNSNRDTTASASAGPYGTSTTRAATITASRAPRPEGSTKASSPAVMASPMAPVHSSRAVAPPVGPGSAASSRARCTP